MKRNKPDIIKLAGDTAFVAAITLLNRCVQKNERPLVKRNMDEQELNRRLNIVNLVYHAIGIFYNE